MTVMTNRARHHPGEGESHPREGKRPSVRQVYALAAALCERDGERWPETQAEASELIERLRRETGHPAPRLEDTPPVTRAMRRRRGRNRGRGDPIYWD